MCTPVLTCTPVYTDYLCTLMYTCIHGLPVYTRVKNLFVYSPQALILQTYLEMPHTAWIIKNEHSILNEFVFSFFKLYYYKVKEHNIDHAGGVSTTLHQHPRCCPRCCIELRNMHKIKEWRPQISPMWTTAISNVANPVAAYPALTCVCGHPPAMY